MSKGPSFLSLDESDAIAALLADLDAPLAAGRERPRPEQRASAPAAVPDAPVADAPVAGPPPALSFADRPPKPEVPPPLPLPEAYAAPAASPPPFSRKASSTFAAFNWRNPAPPPPPPPEPPAAPEPQRELAPWLRDEPPIRTKPVPAGRYRLGEFLAAVNWRNAAKPPALPERLQALIPPPPKPALLEDPDAAAGNRRGRKLSVAEVLGQFAFD